MSRIEDAFGPLVAVRTTGDVDRVVERLGKSIDWVPLGNNPENYGMITMGSEPFNGITERITNAMDAMIELAVELDPELKKCATPRAAVEAIYGLKDGNLREARDIDIGQLASNIKVRFLDGSEPKKPTIEFIDRGIGQHPSDFPKTLLALGGNYKISKFYLIGAFGQGGQTSFAFADYGVIVSRKHRHLLTPGQADLVGWSIVRRFDPSTDLEFHKYGRWEYCVVAGTSEVPTADPGALPFAFENGTLIRLVSYELPKGSGGVLQPGTSAWGNLSQALFDPVLPIRLYEARERFETNDRPISGLARRLYRGTKEKKERVWGRDSYKLDLGVNGSVRINYWALTPIDENDRWSDIKKGLVSGSQAVFVTLNGQRHHVENTSFLRDAANLVYSNDHVIVQVDCDALSKEAKKKLIPSTRERLIEGEFKDLLLNEIGLHLRGDRNILRFEEERKKKFLSVRSARDTTRIRKLVGHFIAENPDLRALIQTTGDETEKGDKPQRERKDGPEEDEDEVRPEELLIPVLYPIPTFLTVANKKDPVPVEKGGSALIRLETDANDEYFADSWSDHFRGIHLANLTSFKSASGLQSGKISYHISCPETAKVGHREAVRFELDLPDGGRLTTERDVVCVKQIDRKRGEGDRKVPEPNIKAVTQEGEPILWGELSWTKESVGRVFLGRTTTPGIYVNMDNVHLKAATRAHTRDPDLLKSIEDRYVSGVAYYLVLRKAEEMQRRIAEEPEGQGDHSAQLDLVARTLAAVAVPFEKVGSSGV